MTIKNNYIILVLSCPASIDTKRAKETYILMYSNIFNSMSHFGLVLLRTAQFSNQTHGILFGSKIELKIEPNRTQLINNSSVQKSNKINQTTG